MVNRLKQDQVDYLVFEYMLQANVCMTKKAIVKCLMLSFNSVSKALTRLKKRGFVTFFRSNYKAYWGFIYE